jgi:hypothetical protein
VATIYRQTVSQHYNQVMQTFRSLSVTLLLILIHGQLLSQDYFPMDLGNKWYYIFGRDALVQAISPPDYVYNGRAYQALIDVTPEVVVDSSRLDFEGRTYYIYRKEREGIGFDTLYVRKDSSGNIYCFNEHSGGEHLYMPSSPKKGSTWRSDDNLLEFQIVTLKGKFRSDTIRYKNCLVISVRNLNDEREPLPVFHYFCKGIGEVGTKIGDQIFLTLLRKENVNER